MKDLDQPSRALLRKYGVRFGAYHIYFPGLLKPAARSLALLLWAEKQGNVDVSTLSTAQHLASSGRTSFPADKELPRDAYRMLGYRQCGERAVRVDILERLADLIRPALAWRDNAPGTKPAGAFDGRGFVVTQAMTSLTGSAGEDFASILRALGYRMDRRPALPEKPVEKVETVSAETPPVEATAQEVSGDPQPSAALLPELNMGAAANDNAPPAPAVAEAPAPEAEPVAEAVPATEEVVEAAPAEAAVEAPAVEAPAAETPCRGRLPTPRLRRRQPRLRLRKRRLPKHRPLQQKRRPSPLWSKSGAPAAVTKSAARARSATATVITAISARPTARLRKPAMPSRRNRRRGVGEKSGEHRRRRNRHRDFGKPREAGAEGAPPPRARRARASLTTSVKSAAIATSVLKARARIATSAATSSRTAAIAAGVIATRAAAVTASPALRCANTPPAPIRATIAPPIRTRRSQSSRR